jgi:alpha-D-xyloside xylohydrolase
MVTNRTLLLCTALLVFTAANAAAQSDAVQSVRRTATGIEATLATGTLRLDVWGDDVVRVRFAEGDTPERASFAVIGQPAASQWTDRTTEGREILRTPRLTVTLDHRTGALTFLDAQGGEYLREPPSGRDLPVKDGARGAVQRFALADDEAIYGLGQHPTGLLDNRGSTIRLQQLNTDIGVPVFLSSKGYGVFWDNPSVTEVEIPAAITGKPMQIASERATGIDYYFIAGPELDRVIADYRRLTGEVPLMARWQWGYWQSKEHYATQDELIGVVRKYREMDVPFDAVIQDWQYWVQGQWGEHRFDPARYPDPKAMVDSIHAMHAHTIVSIWPRFDLGTKNLAELEKVHGVYETVFNNVWPHGQGKWYDPFNPKAREVYWRQIDRTMASYGFDGYWLDASEAELGGRWGQMRDVTTAAGPGADVYNAYPLMHTTAVYEGQRRDVPSKRPFILTRSAFAGEQRNASVIWSGDVASRWDVLRRQIPEGLNFVLTGIPYWNTDIGGFFGPNQAGIANPTYEELFTRWFQFGAFTPMFRVHGSGVAKEFWRFDTTTQKTLVAYDDLRYRLLPYIYAVSWMVTNQGYTMMRPLVMDFRDDRAALNIPDEYMFGPAILVAPVVNQGATSRSVYLPGRAPWYDFYTGQRYDGGQFTQAKAPLSTLPLFVRAGAIVPMGPVVPYAEAQTGKPLEVRVYRGADGTFTLYDDAGDGPGYQKGEHVTIPFSWDEATGQLTIGAQQGSYPKMPASRTFNIVFVGENHGAGIAESPTADRTVTYTGAAVTVAAR